LTDEDADGLTNLMEYALGGNPRIPDATEKGSSFEVVKDQFCDFIYYIHTERIDDLQLMILTNSLIFCVLRRKIAGGRKWRVPAMSLCSIAATIPSPYR
jgi:hypothetical protein